MQTQNVQPALTTTPAPSNSQAVRVALAIINSVKANPALHVDAQNTTVQNIAAIVERELGTPAPTGTPAPLFSEAPLSWNVRAISVEGFEEQFTVRGQTIEGFFKRVQTTKQALLDLEYKPVSRSNGHSAAAESAPAEQAPMCAIHNKPMSKVQGAKGSFWSCHEKLTDGTYCPYKPPKA